MRKKRDQALILRWLSAYEDVAAVHVKRDKYQKRTPIKYNSCGSSFVLDTTHASLWAVLVILAKDLSVDRTDVWQSLSRLAYLSGMNQSTLEDALEDLETVGLVRRQSRGKKQSSITHIAMKPWLKGERYDARAPQELEDEPEAADTTTLRPQEVTADQKESILMVLLSAFNNPPCLSAREDKDRLIRSFPQFAGIAGSAMRLLALFVCIHNDNSAAGLKLKANFAGVKNASAYIHACLSTWVGIYSKAMDSYLELLVAEEEEENAHNGHT